jgi:hypothetical protein
MFSAVQVLSGNSELFLNFDFFNLKNCANCEFVADRDEKNVKILPSTALKTKFSISKNQRAARKVQHTYLVINKIVSFDYHAGNSSPSGAAVRPSASWKSKFFGKYPYLESWLYSII